MAHFWLVMINSWFNDVDGDGLMMGYSWLLLMIGSWVVVNGD